MIQIITFDKLSFIFGISLLAVLIIYLAWKSTLVESTRNLTLIIVPEPRIPAQNTREMAHALSGEGDPTRNTTTDPNENDQDTADDDTVPGFSNSHSLAECNESEENVSESNSESSTSLELPVSSSFGNESSDVEISPEADNIKEEFTKSSDINEKDSSDDIKIRLKFFDDRQKVVTGKLSDDILTFKTKHFNIELAENRIVRLIYNGKLLKEDTATLSSYGICDNSVLHCHVSQPKTPPSATTSSNNNSQRDDNSLRRRVRNIFRFNNESNSQNTNDPTDDIDQTNMDGLAQGFDISNYIVVLLWLTVLFLWFMRFNHSYMFSTFSTFMLIFLTMLMIVPYYFFLGDERFSVTYTSTTLSNFGIDRIFVLTPNQSAQGGTSTEGQSTSAASTSDSISSNGTAEETDQSSLERETENSETSNSEINA